jgi:hypothetical protein
VVLQGEGLTGQKFNSMKLFVKLSFFLLFLSVIALAAPEGFEEIGTIEGGTNVYADMGRIDKVSRNCYSIWLNMEGSPYAIKFEIKKLQDLSILSRMMNPDGSWDKWEPHPKDSYMDDIYEVASTNYRGGSSTPPGFAETSINPDGSRVYVQLKTSKVVGKGHYRAWVLVSTMKTPVLLELRKNAGDLYRRAKTSTGWSSWKYVDKGTNFDNVYNWLQEYHKKKGGPYGMQHIYETAFTQSLGLGAVKGPFRRTHSPG